MAGLLAARCALARWVDHDLHADILAGTGNIYVPAERAVAAVHEAFGSTAIQDIAKERARQVEKEGWTPVHDDQHMDGALAKAAACYALVDFPNVMRTRFWPWDKEWWKPKDRRRDLVKAAALIVAEIERIDRSAEVTRQMVGAQQATA